jgi:hypothetical protein
MKARLLVRSALASLALVAASGGLASIASTASASSSPTVKQVELSAWYVAARPVLLALNHDYLNAMTDYYGMWATDVLVNDRVKAIPAVPPNFTKLTQVCLKMGTDAITARAHPVPDAPLIQSHWAKVVNDAATAAGICTYDHGWYTSKNMAVALRDMRAINSQETIVESML